MVALGEHRVSGSFLDGLKNEERVQAWKAAWSISLTGMALVTRNFKFHRVNPQWLKILGVSAAEFYGKTFLDITTPEIRAADEVQAKLVIEGKINSYLMHKSYRFSTGEEKNVTLLVTRIPVDCEQSFQYFLCRIMLREEINMVHLNANLSRQISTSKSVIWIGKYGKWIMGAGLFFGAVLAKYYGVVQ